MKKYYVRRKDLTPFPFQYYYDQQGVQHKLPKGQTFTFAIHPQKSPPRRWRSGCLEVLFQKIISMPLI